MLCQRLQSVQGLEEKQVYADMLDQLYPDVRVRLNAEGRMLLYYPVEKVRTAPKSMCFTAYYVEEVHQDGTAKVIKDALGGRPGLRLPRATIKLDAFPSMRFNVPPPPTAWERLVCESPFE